MVLDNKVEKDINGNVYAFCFPIKYLFKAERELTTKNILVALANAPLTMEDTYTLFKYAFIGGGNTSDKAEQAFMDAVDEMGFVQLSDFIFEVLQKSGVFGKVKKA